MGQTRLELIIKYRKQGLTYQGIGEILRLTRQRIHQIISQREVNKEIDKEMKKELAVIRQQEPFVKRFKYYCFKCENDFKSQLPPGQAICTKCGSEKIMTL